MDVEVSAEEPGDLEVDVLGVPVSDPPDASRFDERIRPRLQGMPELSGETGSTVVVHLNGELPVAPVYVDGAKTVTLKGERIAEEFQALVEEYVRRNYAPGAARSRARQVPIKAA